MKLAFVGRFLLAFAILIVLSEATGLLHFFGAAVEVTAHATSPALNGWTFEPAQQVGSRRALHFRRGSESLAFQLNLELLALGLLPLLSLISATPHMSWRQRSIAAVLGSAGLFALDLIIVLAYPWMVRNPTALKDITGTFLGLLTFVGGPVILWFALTYRHLQAVWNLDRVDD